MRLVFAGEAREIPVAEHHTAAALLAILSAIRARRVDGARGDSGEELWVGTSERDPQLAHALTMCACRWSYGLRDQGQPVAALRVLLHAASAADVLLGATSARAHLRTDICNLLRGLGRLPEALARCSEAVRRAISKS